MTRAVIHNRACISGMRDIGPLSSIDLVFADPPFNIGYEYDTYLDDRKPEDYLRWSTEWLLKVSGALKPTGTLWVAIGDEYVADLKVMICQMGFHLRNWVIWHYRFGQQLKAKFGRDKTHLLYFTRDTKNFTWNPDDIRVRSARQDAGDKRANPNGKVPGDVWEFPRVCGTHEERLGWHPCQMPEAVLERIILACSNSGDWVLDPFAGSGTTIAVAKRLGRNAVGFEISQDYARRAQDRADSVQLELL